MSNRRRALRVFVSFALLSMVPLLAVAQSLSNPMQWYSNESKLAAAGAAAVDRGTPEERAALAEEILAGRELASGRAFDPTIRNIILASLANKPAAALRALKLEPAPLNVGDSSADLSFTPLTPCRIIDTRLAGGAIAAGSTRNFVVAGTTGFTAQGGNATGCGVPVGATSVLINFTAVNPQGLGNLKGSAYPSAIPATGSIVNYQALTPALNIANGLAFPICDPSVATCTFDMTLLANASGTDVVADVLGYFSRFKKEQVKSFVVNSTSSGASYTTSCTNVGSTVMVIAPVAGQVVVHADVLLHFTRSGSSGISTDYETYIGTSPTSCLNDYGAGQEPFYEIAPGTMYYRPIALDHVFSVTAGSVTTFYINGQAFAVQAGDAANVFAASIVATFIPN